MITIRYLQAKPLANDVGRSECINLLAGSGVLMFSNPLSTPENLVVCFRISYIQFYTQTYTAKIITTPDIQIIPLNSILRTASNRQHSGNFISAVACDYDDKTFNDCLCQNRVIFKLYYVLQELTNFCSKVVYCSIILSVAVYQERGRSRKTVCKQKVQTKALTCGYTKT